MPSGLLEPNAWEQIATWIFRIAGDIRYGKVEITIHDARVVQLEVTEKFRTPEEGRPNEISRRRKDGRRAPEPTG